MLDERGTGDGNPAVRGTGDRIFPTRQPARIGTEERRRDPGEGYAQQRARVVAIYAGNQSPYRDDETEIRAFLTRLHESTRSADITRNWWPYANDFLEEAVRHSRTPHGVADLRVLVDVVRRNAGQGAEVRFFGHGRRGAIQFGGGVEVTAPALRAIRGNDRQQYSLVGRVRRVVFYACDAAQDAELFRELASLLNVPVCGFGQGIKWVINWRGPVGQRRIVWRGMGTLRWGKSGPANGGTVERFTGTPLCFNPPATGPASRPTAGSVAR